MFNNQFFRTIAGLIMVLIMVFLVQQIPYLAQKLTSITTIVLFPLLITGFFYYLLRPAVRFFNQKIKNKTLAMLITFVGLLCIIGFISYFAGNIIYTEIGRLISFLADYKVNIKDLDQAFSQAEELVFLKEFNLEERLANLVQGVVNRISNYNFLNAFTSLTQLGITMILIPFLLIYFLKDDRLLVAKLLSLAPAGKRRLIKESLTRIDTVFEAYIPSQLLVGLISGCIMLTGYLLIGIPNPIGLAIILALASIIPFLGPALGVLPAVFIALTNSFEMLIQVALLMFVVQEIENNLVRPVLQGNRLDMHPVVVIIVILIATILFGILGALLAVPVFASVRDCLELLDDKRE